MINNSKYKQVDRPFFEWAKSKNLHIYTQYKDYDVRSFDLVLSADLKWQIWLEPIPESGKCTIQYWDYKTNKYRKTVKVDKLKDTLDKIYNDILS